jgi:hypothetical protein
MNCRQSWQDIALTAREEADAQTFENGFFNIFGVTRSQIAIFEQKVRQNKSHWQCINKWARFLGLSTLGAGILCLVFTNPHQ